MKEGCCLAAVMAILIAVFTVSAYAQYSGECWAADYYNLFKISANGQAATVQGFSQPLSLDINPTDGSIWVADTDAVRVRKLSAAGQDLFELNSTSTPPAFTTNPKSVSVDPRDGSCWVAVFDTIYKYSADGKQLAKVDGFSEPVVAVSPLNGDCWVAHNNLGMIHTNRGQLADAARHYREALRIHLTYAEALTNLGGVLVMQGNPYEAQRCFRLAIQYQPDHVQAHNNLGNLLATQMQFEEAMKLKGVVITSSPSPILRARTIRCKALVPLFTTVAYLTPA